MGIPKSQTAFACLQSSQTGLTMARLTTMALLNTNYCNFYYGSITRVFVLSFSQVWNWQSSLIFEVCHLWSDSLLQRFYLLLICQLVTAASDSSIDPKVKWTVMITLVHLHASIHFQVQKRSQQISMDVKVITYCIIWSFHRQNLFLSLL